MGCCARTNQCENNLSPRTHYIRFLSLCALQNRVVEDVRQIHNTTTMSFLARFQSQRRITSLPKKNSPRAKSLNDYTTAFLGLEGKDDACDGP
mmetsp:Transcript_43818/g.70435  ORF Transcript_43818/g.70435 Transcript_43818/m.70435 type:complete len:93 (-) Transcript_43818:31-309(-)